MTLNHVLCFTNYEQVMDKSREGDGWGQSIIMITFLSNQNPHSLPVGADTFRKRICQNFRQSDCLTV